MLLFQTESPILLLGIAGIYICLTKYFNNKYFVFIGFYTFWIGIIYSAIPYKTPWLSINLIMPLIICASIFCYYLIQKYSRHRKFLIIIIVIIISSQLYQSIKLNFFKYDDNENYMTVYVQTSCDIISMVNNLKNKFPDIQNTSILIASKDYWPIPWYIRNYKNVNYFTGLQNNKYDVIITNTNPDINLPKEIFSNYSGYIYKLRQGVYLTLWLKK